MSNAIDHIIAGLKEARIYDPNRPTFWVEDENQEKIIDGTIHQLYNYFLTYEKVRYLCGPGIGKRCCYAMKLEDGSVYKFFENGEAPWNTK